jgi:hypothetical protein
VLGATNFFQIKVFIDFLEHRIILCFGFVKLILHLFKNILNLAVEVIQLIFVGFQNAIMLFDLFELFADVDVAVRYVGHEPGHFISNVIVDFGEPILRPLLIGFDLLIGFGVVILGGSLCHLDG